MQLKILKLISVTLMMLMLSTPSRGIASVQKLADILEIMAYGSHTSTQTFESGVNSWDRNIDEQIENTSVIKQRTPVEEIFTNILEYMLLMPMELGMSNS